MRVTKRPDIGLGRRFAFLLMTLTLLIGCGTDFHSPTQQFARGKEIDSVYIYSFLDWHENTFGPAVLKEFRSQLPEALSKRGVRSEQLWFNQSPLRSQIWLEKVTPAFHGFETSIPVDEVIKENHLAEANFGSNYRLVIFPERVVVGMGNSLTVRWALIDSASSELVWLTKSTTMNMNPLSGSEVASDKAKLIVDGIIAAMAKSGVIRQN